MTVRGIFDTIIVKDFLLVSKKFLKTQDLITFGLFSIYSMVPIPRVRTYERESKREVSGILY